MSCTSRIGLFCCLSVTAGLSAAVQAASPSPAQRTLAAQTTAEQAAACAEARPFYWEIGDANGTLASGQIGPKAPARDTPLQIASASKWIYAAYVAEQRHGQLSDADIRFLTFRSGYTRFRNCRRDQTVGACMGNLINGFGAIRQDTENRFDYNGGHMQKHAMLMGLGNDDAQTLATELNRSLTQLGPDWVFHYTQAQPAGGGETSAASYAQFLRALLGNTLQLAPLLGSHAVCASPTACPAEAVKTPIPSGEAWHYSIGHWVEDDPRLGDGSFSSPGAFGFYPWISHDRQLYGILARESRSGILSLDEYSKPWVQSVVCGRTIRAAWLDGQPRR